MTGDLVTELATAGIFTTVGAAGALIVQSVRAERRERAEHERHIDLLAPALATVRPAGVMVVRRRRPARIAAVRRRLAAGWDWARARVVGLWLRATSVRLRVVLVSRPTLPRRPIAELDCNTPTWPVNAPVDGVRVGVNPVHREPVEPLINPDADLGVQLHALDGQWRQYAESRPTDPDATGFMPRVEVDGGVR